MNCIPARETRLVRLSSARPLLARLRLPLLTLLAVAAGCAAAAQQDVAPQRIYEVAYTVTPRPGSGTAEVLLRLRQPRSFLRELSMDMPPARFRNLSGDGDLQRDGDRVTWLPPAAGGELRWTVAIAHRRNGESYDAWLGDDWAIFRGTDIVPPAATRTVVGARGLTTLRFELPSGWSSLTPYRERDDVYTVVNDSRRFDRPAGWMLLGDIGVRFETIAGIRVLVGGPTDQGVRRMDMLALLNWTLPPLVRLLPDFPDRLTIVSAAASMWRGGLSGPRSLFVHADLPLISENGTSTLLHEILHVGMGLDAADGADWIIEGLAEYYTLEILRRSRTLTPRRFQTALEDLEEWGAESGDLCSGESTAATTARAVTVFAALHREMRRVRGRPDPLDELLRTLVAPGNDVTLGALRRTATTIHGELPDALSTANLPGCR